VTVYKRCACVETCRHRYWWRFRLHGREYRGSTRTANHRLALRRATEQYHEILEGRIPTRRSALLLSTLIVEYQAHIDHAHRTASKASRILSQFREFVGDRRIVDVGPFHVEKWKVARAREVGQSTVNRELNVIRGMFRWAVTMKHVTDSPAARVTPYRVDGVRIRVLSDEEIQAVLTRTPADIALLCRATLECLPRLSELLSLKREHIGPTWIELRRKGGRIDRVEVSAELRAALLERAQRHRKGFVFVGRSGEPPSQESVSSYVTRIMRRLGLQGVSHHTMRHTGVTLMLEQGIDHRTIQQLAGWTSLRMLERYGHPRDKEARRAVTTMHDYLAGVEQRLVQAASVSTKQAGTKTGTPPGGE
jgi:site-specific recombinase XerD